MRGFVTTYMVPPNLGPMAHEATGRSVLPRPALGDSRIAPTGIIGGSWEVRFCAWGRRPAGVSRTPQPRAFTRDAPTGNAGDCPTPGGFETRHYGAFAC